MRPISSSPVSVLSPQMSPPEKSPWHSPVPYLFGGLAAMLGLIAFALLILACSYWSLSNRGNGDESEERDVESGEKEGNDVVKQPKVYEEKFLVIMAGMDKPTFVATPVTTKVCVCNQQNEETEKNDEGLEKVESEEKSKTEEGQISSSDEETEDHDQN